MKKLIVCFLSVIMTSLAASAVDYRGFVEINGGIAPQTEYASGQDRYFRDYYVSFSTTHGVQLNRYLFVGAGMDLNLNTKDNEYPMGVNVYGDVRFDMNITKKWTPFINLKVGYGIMTPQVYCVYYPENSQNSDSYGNSYVDYKPFFINPSVGVRLRLSSKCGLNFGVGYIPLALGKISKDQHGYGITAADVPAGYKLKKDKSKGAITVNIGVDF